MNIEHALSLCGPKSASFVFTCHDAAPAYHQPQRSGGQALIRTRSRKSGTAARLHHGDILIALGVVQSREALGLSLIMARHNQDQQDKRKAIESLARIARQQAPAHVGKIAGRNMGQCMLLLAVMAVGHYCRTADDPQNRCRCGGRGKIVDMTASKASGKTVEKVCPRCSGSGLKPVTSASVYKVIKTLVPTLTQRTWSRNWKTFYDELVDRCQQEAYQAAALFSEITESVR
ncbi:antitermination protein [Pectobacterium betavasculorum]|uniref:antitermination protein Q n=1 Tax=Pectobacterium betavasculorum TaxID=55207 RepID=UPI00068AD935|nr:antitermination protein [Pectobacterium betavasculorum]